MKTFQITLTTGSVETVKSEFFAVKEGAYRFYNAVTHLPYPELVAAYTISEVTGAREIIVE